MAKMAMGVRALAVLAGALCLMSANINVRAAEGPYLDLGVGGAFMEDFNVSFPDTGGLMKTDPGERFTLGLGYTMYASESFDSAIQFETGVLHNSLRSLSSFDFEVPADGDVYQVPFLVDFLWTLHVGPRLMPYAGIGGGGVYRRVQLDNLDGFYFNESSTETDWAIQATAGLRFRLDEHNELGAVYKYLATFPREDDMVGTHTISLVYVMRF